MFNDAFLTGWEHLKQLENIGSQIASVSVTEECPTEQGNFYMEASSNLITSSHQDSTENDKMPVAKDKENYDSFSEDKTSGSEYCPSDSVSELSENSDHNYYVGIDKKIKTDLRRSKRKVRRNYNIPLQKSKPKLRRNPKIKHGIELDSNKPSTSKYRPNHVNNFDYEQDIQDNTVSTNKEMDSPKPTSENKINIISNVLIKPSEVTESNIPDSTTKMVSDKRSANLVKIAAAKKNYEGKRIRDKKHCCYYCHEMILHMARHFEVKHSEEMDVARVLAFPKKSNKRKELFSELIRAGDFHYNCEVISLKQGELILVRRPTMNEIVFNKYSDYGPCPNCLGFLLKKHLWLHLKTSCRKNNSNDQIDENPEYASRQIIAESNAILSNVFGTEFSSAYKKYIVNHLRGDDVGDCCKEDNIILKFGAMLFEKYGLTQCELIRQNMRQLARLIITVKEMTSQNLKLFDLLTPQRFDIVVQGVKQLCGRHQNDSTKRPEFNIPSLALKLGHSLKKCANIERGLALRQENIRRNEALLAFCNLMELEWQTKISSNALSTLYKKKLNVGQLLPLTSDLLKCNSYIKTQIEQSKKQLIETHTTESWGRLAKLILCRIILFNKRRAGEASKMTMEQYTTRPLWTTQSNQELITALTPYEVKLAERHIIVNIIGKRGRIVPVLLTPETKEGIDILIKYRTEAVGINPKNPYIFSRCMMALTHLRGPDVLKRIVGEVEELEKPILITSTKLRKYVATVCQVFDLSENEYDWLARHLGHDIRVHREFYRLHEDVVELTKISRLLMAVDTGEANKFAGKQLKDIKLGGM